MARPRNSIGRVTFYGYLFPLLLSSSLRLSRRISGHVREKATFPNSRNDELRKELATDRSDFKRVRDIERVSATRFPLKVYRSLMDRWMEHWPQIERESSISPCRIFRTLKKGRSIEEKLVGDFRLRALRKINERSRSAICTHAGLHYSQSWSILAWRAAGPCIPFLKTVFRSLRTTEFDEFDLVQISRVVVHQLASIGVFILSSCRNEMRFDTGVYFA